LLGWNTDSRRNIALLEAVKPTQILLSAPTTTLLPLGLDFSSASK